MRVTVLVVLLAALRLQASDIYLRGGGGWERSATTSLRDRDCASTNPPALFGCGFEARGAWDETTPWEAAIGVEASRGRWELAFSGRDLDFTAQSNFTGVTGSQPVTARARSQSVLLVGTFDLAARTFVTAGAGMARNTLGEVTFAFPGIAPDAVTIIPAGRHTGFAWMAGVGGSLPLTAALHLDVSVRFQHHGELRTEAGPATIVRPRGTVVIDVDATGAELTSSGAYVSLRLRL